MNLPEYLITLVVGLFGGGAAASLLRMRHDKEIGTRTADLSEDDASERWWHDRLKAQAELLVEPLRTEVGELRSEVRTLREEVSAARTRYWRAVHLIRALYAWIATHVPGDVPAPPQPHEDIVDDI